jgi:hypothetical protein
MIFLQILSIKPDFCLAACLQSNLATQTSGFNALTRVALARNNRIKYPQLLLDKLIHELLIRLFPRRLAESALFSRLNPLFDPCSLALGNLFDLHNREYDDSDQRHKCLAIINILLASCMLLARLEAVWNHVGTLDIRV